MIDYASDHKLNGLIIWGFLNDQHGGIDSAQRLSRYARERSVRILPGFGTVCYGGYYHSGNSPWSLTTWMSQHPEVKRYIDEKGVTQKDFPCPSDPTYQKWLRDGAKWVHGDLSRHRRG